MQINFPNNPITGQTFTDLQNNIWYFDGTYWGNEKYGTVTELNDFTDYDDLTPIADEVIGYEHTTGYWVSKELAMPDYLFRISPSVDLTITPLDRDIIFDQTDEEYGVSGRHQVDSRYKIPKTGWWEIEFCLSSPDGHSYSVQSWINLTINGVDTYALCGSNSQNFANSRQSNISRVPIVVPLKYNDLIGIRQPYLTGGGTISATRSFLQGIYLYE